MPLEHILKNSSQSGKEPTAGQLDYGEISLNFHEDGPFICCKDTSGAVRRIAGIWVNNTAPATPTPGVWWLDTSVSPAQVKVYESAAAGWLIVGSGGGGGGGGGGLTGIAASAPLTSTGGASPTLGITNATLTAAGAMSAADKTKLDGLSNYTLPIATSTKAGGVMVGENLVIAAGKLSAQLPGALIYKGTIDLTAAAPATRVTGDTYVNSKAGTIEASWTGLSGSAAAGDMVLWGGSTWDRVGATGFGVTSVTGAAPITVAGTAASPEVGVSAATAAATGVVRLADAAAITAGTAGRVVDAAQLSAATPDASTTAKGLVQLADAAAVMAGTAGRMVDAAQLKSAQAAASGSATAPTTPTAGQVWVDSSVTPAVIKVWNGTTWVAQSGATITSATAPAAPATGQLWVDSSVTPNVTKIWDGTAWVTATPDGAAVAAIANDAKYATKAELAVENTWDRTGTTLSPATAGDLVAVAALPTATATAAGIVQLADAAAITAGTAGRVVDAAQLKAAQAAASGSATAPAAPTAGQVWVDSSVTPAVIKVWSGTAWIPQAGATVTSATAPTAPTAGQVWVDTSTAPNVTKIWDGTAWVTATPDGAAVAAIANDAKYATKTELATENTWDRTGTSLAPHTAGDVVTVSAGTAALPGLTPVGDPNTGIYSPGADQLAISTGGTGRLFVDAAGNVAIGATPVRNFSVTGSGFPLTVFKNTSASLANSVNIHNDANLGISFISYGSAYAGGSNLSVGPSGSAISSSGDFAFIADKTIRLGLGTSAGTERVRIDSSGKVGIGTSAPGAALHLLGAPPEIRIESTTASDGILRFVNTSGSMSIGMTGAPVNSFVIGDRKNSQIAYEYSGGASGFHSWLINNTERLRLDSGGRLLMGASSAARTDAPIQLLQAIGTDPARTLLFSRNTAVADAVNGNIDFLSSTGQTARISAANDGPNQVGSAPGRLVFSTTPNASAVPVERMRITSSGKVGIGTNAPTATLTVNGTANVKATVYADNAAALAGGLVAGDIYRKADGTLMITF